MIIKVSKGMRRRLQSGDTIVEVTIALTVLALVLGTSSLLANRNAKTLQNAQEKNIAVRYAQQQLEFLKTRVAADPTIISSAPPKFCMTNADTSPVGVTAATCKISNGGATYEQVVTLESVPGGGGQLFNAKATVEWETLTSWLDDAGNLQNKGNVQLTYRVYTKLGANRNPEGIVCGPGLVWVAAEAGCRAAPTATLTASAASIVRGNGVTLSWSSQNVTSCTTSWGGALASGGGLAVGTSGSETVTPTSTTNYTVICSGTRGSATASVTVTVTAPHPPRVALHRCYQFYDYGGNLAIKTNHVFTTNSGECNGGGAGGQYEGVTAYAPLSSNSGAIPMYGGRNPAIQDDFYTTSYQEYYNAHYNGWYENSGVRFYVYPYTSSGCTVEGTAPLYRWYSGVTGNHVYPASPNENPNYYAPVDGGGTFVYEGIAGCVFSGP